jgi:phospholipid N-methyltransferase
VATSTSTLRAGHRRLGRFLRQGYEDFDRTANFFPSSPFLVDAMVRAAPLASTAAVVELGPGTGAITRKLLEGMRPDAVLCTIECDALMNQELTRHLGDHRLDAVIGDAQDTLAIVTERGLAGQVGVVVSSLGLSLLTDPVRERIVEAAAAVLAPGGLFVQYVYCHARAVVYSPTRGFSRFHARRYLEGKFERVSRRLVPLNLPPAWVYTCARPRPLH